MKELSIEEKALAYDKAIGALRSLIAEQAIKHCDRVNIKDITNILPELKESDDEGIRKVLLGFLENELKKHGNEEWDCGFHTTDVIAWLEKQGEQKPVDKIQIGKKYKCIASPRYSTFVKGLIYGPEDKFLCSLMNFCSDCFEPIEDDGQKPAEYNREIPTDLKDIVDKETNAIWKEESSDGCHLVIDSFNMFYGICMQIAEAVVDYKKPAWSEEDEYKYNTILHHLDLRKEKYKRECNQEEQDRYQCLYEWLKSLKERYTWKPSEEQMNALEDAIRYGEEENIGILSLLYNDLKKLKG